MHARVCTTCIIYFAHISVKFLFSLLWYTVALFFVVQFLTKEIVFLLSSSWGTDENLITTKYSVYNTTIYE